MATTEMTSLETSSNYLESYYVGVRPEYLIFHSATNPLPRIAGSYPENLLETKDAGKSSKKRPRDRQVNPEDRLCQQTKKGLTCPFGDQCKYSHDIIKYLEMKPPDIGPRCHEYDTYGYCRTGFMCRYGDSHLDKINGINLQRPESEGGVIERPQINILSKELQVALRKKSYKIPTATSETTSTNPAAEEEKSASTNETLDCQLHENELVGLNSSFNSTPYASDSGTKKSIDFSNKVYVAPLTTIGNLPFRRILREFGADITCGEMAMAHNIVEGQSSEWALLKRHESETLFGLQIASGHPAELAQCAKILEHETQSDFVDLNCGCPIDAICSKGAGSALLNRPKKLYDAIQTLTKHLSRPITVKIRTGWDDKNPIGHKLIPEFQKISKGKIAAVMMHGRSRLQRYTGAANWEYILTAARSQDSSLPILPIIGNGDIFSYQDWVSHQTLLSNNLSGEEIGLCDCAMIGRGAIIKPWLPTEIKESRQWDISASERMDMYKRFVWYGLEHWGSDVQGINTTRRFLLEWLSFTHRYVPAGVIEHSRQPQTIFQKPPRYRGRCDLETLLSSPNCTDWVEISKMLLGPLPDGFEFIPKHKTNSYPNATTTTPPTASSSESSSSGVSAVTSVETIANSETTGGGEDDNLVNQRAPCGGGVGGLEWDGDVE